MPYWRTGNPETRFGDWGYDCSGGQTCACRAGGVNVVPTNSADAARWAMKTGRAYAIRNARQAKPGDLVVYDKYGVPQDGYGSRGHIGQVHPDGVHTYESAGSTGVSIHDRGTFWQLAIDMSDFFTPTTQPPPPVTTQEDDMPSGFFAQTNELGSPVKPAPLGTPLAKAPGAQVWLLLPLSGLRMKVIDPPHLKWLAEQGYVRNGANGKPDTQIKGPLPPSYIYTHQLAA